MENVAAFRNFVEDACRREGLDESTCFDLKLVVDEACSNVVRHGYAGREGRIGVTFERLGEEVVLTIVDRAPPFHPDEAPAPNLDAPASERKPGGLGWHLIKSMVDRITYESDATNGNRLTLAKKVAPRQNQAEETE